MKSSIKIFLISMLSIFIFTACCEKKLIIKKEVNKPAPTKQVKKEPVKKPCPVKKSPPSCLQLKLLRQRLCLWFIKLLKASVYGLFQVTKIFTMILLCGPLFIKLIKIKLKILTLSFQDRCFILTEIFPHQTKQKQFILLKPEENGHYGMANNIKAT